MAAATLLRGDPLLLFLSSLDNGQSGGTHLSLLIVQSEDLSALVLVCLAKCLAVFVLEGLVVR